MRLDHPDTERTIESEDQLSERERGSKRKARRWVAVGLVGAGCGALLLTAFLNPGHTLKVDFVVMKDAVVVVNGDDFLYERLYVTMVEGGISNMVICTLGPGQSAEMRPKFTPEYIQVELLRKDVVWRAIWREHVEGKDEQARSLRKRYMMDIVLDQAYGKIDDAGHPNEHGKVPRRDDGSESLLAGSQNPSQEPSYEGRSLSQWISLYFVTDEQGIEMANPWQEGRVDDAVQHMGANALRCLMEWLQYEGDHGNRPASHDSHSLRSWYAMEALRRLGTDTITALPELKLLLNNNTNRLLALKAYCVLEKLKGVAIPTLVEAAENRHHPAHDSIVGYFCELAFGPERAAVMPTLTRLLQDPDPAIQARASNAIDHISSGQVRYPPLTLTRRASGIYFRNGEGEIEAFIRKVPGTKGPRVWRP